MLSIYKRSFISSAYELPLSNHCWDDVQCIEFTNYHRSAADKYIDSYCPKSTHLAPGESIFSIEFGTFAIQNIDKKLLSLNMHTTCWAVCCKKPHHGIHRREPDARCVFGHPRITQIFAFQFGQRSTGERWKANKLIAKLFDHNWHNQKHSSHFLQD